MPNILELFITVAVLLRTFHCLHEQRETSQFRVQFVQKNRVKIHLHVAQCKKTTRAPARDTGRGTRSWTRGERSMSVIDRVNKLLTTATSQSFGEKLSTAALW
jgi:hypothetical protein